MWQSRVEIEGYSVAYFDHFAAFEAAYCWTSVKGRAHMHFINLLDTVDQEIFAVKNFSPVA